MNSYGCLTEPFFGDAGYFLRPHWVIGRRVPLGDSKRRRPRLSFLHVGLERRGVPSAAGDSGRWGSGGFDGRKGREGCARFNPEAIAGETNPLPSTTSFLK